MSFPRYPAYKPSGVEWLGEVPEHWEALRLRFVATLNPSKQEARELGNKEVVSFLPMEAIGEDGSLRLEQEKEISECLSGYTYFRDGDVCIAKITPCFENGKGAILRELKGGLGFGTTELIVARPDNTKITSEFLDYVFRSQTFRRLGESEMYGAGGQKRVPDSFVSDFTAMLPSIEEQSQITNFLDRETAKIDALIAEQQRLIELLQEKRQAVISHAVTKGLNPHAPMKDSGVEWLGEVPEHWEITKLKRITQQISVGIVVEPSKYYDDEGDVPALRSLNVKPCKIDIEDCVYISRRSNELLAKSILRAGDLVLVRTGQPGNCAVVPESLDGCNCIDLIFARKPHQGCSDYLMYQLSSDAARHQYDLGSDGAIQQHFNVKTATNLIIAWPTDCEQRAISSYLNTTLEKLDDMIKTTFSTVLLLQERRSALISAAVTGQIDVRGMVPEVEAA